MTISNFSEEFFFLDPTYPFPVDYEGITYSCMYTALIAAFYADEKMKKRISILDAYSAMTYKPAAVHLSISEINRIVDAKFNGEDDYLYRMLRCSTNKGTKFMYRNDLHDNYLGVCTCPKCRAKNIKGQNILGKLITEFRENMY